MVDTLIQADPVIEDTPPVTEGDVPPPDPQAVDTRPEWLPEKYKTPEDFAKGHSELEKKFGKSAELAKESAKKEIEAAMLANRPKTKGDYVLPDSITPDAAVDNDLLDWWSEHAYEKGYDQDTFEAGIQHYATALAGTQIDFDAETAKLGDNANTRIEAASLFANKFFPDDVMPAISRMCETSDGIVAIEYIIEKMKDPAIAPTEGSGQKDSAEDLQDMVKDPRYWNPTKREAAFVKKVDDGFKALYGG